MKQVRSPETYIGYARAQRFASPNGINQDTEQLYAAPEHPALNEWGLAGKWVDRDQAAQLKSAGGKIIFRFHARDLHLVLGPASDKKPVHFRVTIDGQAPGENHGVDTDAQGNGVVTDQRLYQLVRQKGAIADHTFAIRVCGIAGRTGLCSLLSDEFPSRICGQATRNMDPILLKKKAPAQPERALFTYPNHEIRSRNRLQLRIFAFSPLLLQHRPMRLHRRRRRRISNPLLVVADHVHRCRHSLGRRLLRRGFGSRLLRRFLWRFLFSLLRQTIRADQEHARLERLLQQNTASGAARTLLRHRLVIRSEIADLG